MGAELAWRCSASEWARWSEIQLAENRRLEVEPGGTSFRVRAPDGEVELRVRLTPEGPVLLFSAAQIEIERTKSLKVEVDSFEVCARERISLSSQGDFEQTVARDLTSHCEGRQEVHAGELAITAHKGELVLDATDDLRVNGERVLINC